MKIARQTYVASLEELRKRQPEMTDLLVEWVNINSHSRNITGLNAMADALERAFSVLPVPVERIPLADMPEYTSRGEAVMVPTGPALRWRCRPGAPFRLVLSGHFDTVFPPDHPFCRAEIREGKLHGPGAADMKGGLMILLQALAHFEAHAGGEDLGWDVILVSDEEIGTHSSGKLYEEAAPHAQAALVFEPPLPDGSFSRARRGSGTFNAVVTGKAAHVGRSFAEGRNAIVALAAFMQGVHGLNGQVPGAVFNAGRVDGGGALNVVPEHAAAQFNFRINSPEDIPEITRRIEEIRTRTEAETGCEIHWEGGFTRPPKPCTPPMKAMFAQIQSLAGEMGQTLAWQDTGGCCDGNNLAALGLPNIDTLGVVGAGIHSDQEFAVLDSLPQRAALVALLLYDWASGKMPAELRPAVTG